MSDELIWVWVVVLGTGSCCMTPPLPSTSVKLFEVFEELRLYKPVVTLMEAERPLEAPVAAPKIGKKGKKEKHFIHFFVTSFFEECLRTYASIWIN